jgi:GNAT superfamily N-acetyltransferase
MTNVTCVNEARALFARVGTVSVAAVADSGEPVLRLLRAAVHEDSLLLFEASEELPPAGRVVVVAREVLCDVPIHFRADGLAGPSVPLALTARAQGTLRRHGRPDGNYGSLRLDHVHYDAELGERWPLEERQRVLDELWKRGAHGDVSAIGFLLRRCPELTTPGFLRLPLDVRDRSLRLQCSVDHTEIEETLPLLERLYWLANLTRDEIRIPLEQSTARVAARDGRGNIVAFARAVSDGRCAWIYDVAVAEHVRGEGLGAALMGVLLDHPALRSVRHVRLSTRDAMPFYRRLGFNNLDEAPRYPWTSTEMIKSPLRAPDGAERHAQNLPTRPSPA